MSSEQPPDLIWEHFLLGRPEGTHYGSGTSSALLFGDGGQGLVTHAWRGEQIKEDDTEDDRHVLKWALGISAGVLLAVGAVKATPHVKRWWAVQPGSAERVS